MNDRFTYRGKRLDAPRAWIVGHLQEYVDGAMVIKECGVAWPNALWQTVDPATVGQCTGLRDKNGTLVFEGDILRDKDGLCGAVKWYDEEACFVCQMPTDDRPCHVSLVLRYGAEIIGNVHDAPDLIQKEAQGDV